MLEVKKCGSSERGHECGPRCPCFFVLSHGAVHVCSGVIELFQTAAADTSIVLVVLLVLPVLLVLLVVLSATN